MDKLRKNFFSKKNVLYLALIISFPFSSSATEVTCGSKPGYCYGNQTLSTSDGPTSSNFQGATYSGTGENYVYAAAAQKDSGTGNVTASGSLTMEANSNVNNEVYGADSQLNTNNGGTATVMSGTLTMNAGSAQTSSTTGFAVGGNAVNQYGNASVNQGTLILNSASVAHDALGARAFAGQKGGNNASASANGSISFNASSKVQGNAYGAYSSGVGGATSNGSINLNDSIVSGDLSGAYALASNGDASAYGTVNVTNKSSANNIFAAFAENDGKYGIVGTQGTLNIDSSSLTGDTVIAAYSINNGVYATTADASVTVKDVFDSNNTNLVGAYAVVNNTDNQSYIFANANQFEVSNSNFASITGVNIDKNGSTGGATLANATLNISDTNLTSSTNSLYGTYVQSNEKAGGTASLTLTNVNAAGKVYGAYSQATNDANATATVNASGGSLGALYGAYSQGASAKTFSTLDLKNVNVQGDLYGAQALGEKTSAYSDTNLTINNIKAANVYGAYSDALNSTANSNLSLQGSDISGSLIASYAIGTYPDIASTKATVNISGSQISGDFYGASSGDDISGRVSSSKNSVASADICVGATCTNNPNNKPFSENYDSIIKGEFVGAMAYTDGTQNKDTNASVASIKINNALIGSGKGNFLYGAQANSNANANAVVKNFQLGNGSTINSSIIGAGATGGVANSSIESFEISNSENTTNTVQGYINGSFASASNFAAIASTGTFSLTNGNNVSGDVHGSYSNGRVGLTANSKTQNFIISNADGVDVNNSIAGNVFGSYAAGRNDANATTSMVYIGNTKITSSLSYNSIIGADAYSDTTKALAIVDSNFTITNKSQIDGNVTATVAYAQNGTAQAISQNVFVTNSQLGNTEKESYLQGSYAHAYGDANATTSSLRILDGAFVDSLIHGSYAESTNANAYATTYLFSMNNIEDTNSNNSNGDVFGAYALSSLASATSSVDTFYISNTKIGNSIISNIYGAYANAGSDAKANIKEGNFSVLGASSISGNLYGAYALANNEAQANTEAVTIGNSSIGSSKDNNLTGSFALSHNGNAFSINDFLAIYNGSEVNATIKGSYAQANKGEANATTNTFAITNQSNNNSKANDVNEDAYGSYAIGQSANATTGGVYISDSSIGYNADNNNFTGAYAEASQGNAKASIDNNFSIMDNSYIDGNISGAYALAQNGEASANSVDIFLNNSTLGNKDNPTFFYGTYALAGQDANANTASLRILNGTEINSSLIAAYAESLNSNAYANNGIFSINNINGNTTSNNANGDIYGAYALANNGEAQATNGEFYISNANIGTTSKSSIIGAYASSKFDANASFAKDNNSFSILNSSASGDIFAAKASSSQGSAYAKAGNFYLDNSSVGSQGDTLTGAWASGAEESQAYASSFMIYDGSKIEATNSYGVYANSQNSQASANIGTFALGNSANKEQNIINGNIYAAYVNAQKDADATSNEIYIANSKITGNTVGLFANSANGNANAISPSIIQILNGTIIDGDLTGAYAQANLNANAKADILISNSTLGEDANSVSGDIIGAYASSLTGNATANSSIELLNTTVEGDITAAYASSANSASANNNALTLQNSTVNGNIYLGVINGTGTANNNVLNIYSGNTINSKEIWGGYEANLGKASSSNNLVKGNTFNFYAGANPLKVEKLRNFDVYNVETWGQGVKLFNNDKNSAFITVTNEIGNDSLTSNGTYQSTFYVFNSGITFADGETLKAGDKMYILNADGAKIINGNNMNDAFKLGNDKINVGLIYQAGINIGQGSDQTIYAEITNPIPRDEDKDKDIWHYIGGGTYDNTANAGKQPEPSLPDQPSAPNNNKPDEGKNPIQPKPVNPDENLTLPSNPVEGLKPTNPDANVTVPKNPVPPKTTKPPFTTDQHAVDRLQPTLEGRIASLMAVDGSFNAVIDDVWKKLKLANEGDIIPFALLQGSHDRYNSGSHIKNNGFNLIAGSAYNFSHSLGGWFYEYGKGNYDTHNFFPAYDNFEALNFKASGKLTHYGIGLLGKTYLYNDKIYFDGGVRYGRLKNSFDTSSFTDGNYRAVNPNYTDRANYFGAYAGTGFLASLTKKHNFDTSIKYIYNEVQKSDVTIDGSKIKFDKATSSRIKVAEDYKYETNKYLALTAGLAYEYEFDGKAKGSIDGNKIKSPKMKGSTGIGSLGVSLTPFNGGDKNKVIDFSVKGYTGKHEGVSGNINFQYNFN